MIIPISKKYDTEFDLYYSLISLYNTVEQWGLTQTQIKILIYLIRHDYNKTTKEIICKNLKISEKSLTTNLSYLRQGKIGKRKIKKLLKTSTNNMNITLLSTELNDIKKLIESKDDVKSFIIDFGEEKFINKIGKTITNAISKKLNVVLDSEILEEISKELGIDIKDVKNTYKIWLDYLDYISNETSQCTVSFPKLGEMYISLVKMKRNMRTKRLKLYKEIKSKEIDLLRDKCKYIVHEKSVPIILKYGVSKRKYSKEILKEKPPFYTQRELADLQNKVFFEEDRDFSENEKIKKLFIEND